MSSAGEERISIDTYHTSHATTVHTLAGQPHGRATARHRPRPQPQSGRSGRRSLRFMQRDGRFQMVFLKSPVDWSPFLLDIYTTLVEIRWRVMLLLFSLSYILSWLLFALLYWLIAYTHGDLAAPDNAPCVENVRSFTAAFLFSMETQATIGYGFRGMTENCMAAIVVVTVQDLLSCIIDTVVIGVAIAKMASARKRAQVVGFSRCAVVNMRDGALCLSWRLGDFRGQHILEGVARAQVVRYVTGPTGAVEVSYRDLELQDRDVILATPATIVHRLEPGSPLYSWGPGGDNDDDDPWEQGETEAETELEAEAKEGAKEGDFELVVSFTYTGSMGMLHQTRTSYAVSDIRWGQRFLDMLTLGTKCYKVDYALFNQTAWVPVPRLSAEEHHRGSSRRPAQTSVSRELVRGGDSGYRPGATRSRDRTGAEPPEVLQEVRL